MIDAPGLLSEPGPERGSPRGDRRYSRDVGDTRLGQGNGEPRRTSMLVAPNIDPSSTERLREPDAPGATLIDRTRSGSQETEEGDAMTALTAETAARERCTQTAAVAACTAAAAHRRDHRHGAEKECHPHVVEVVRLGALAIAVCHDCGRDSGFVPGREAEAISQVHRQATLDASALLAAPAAA